MYSGPNQDNGGGGEVLGKDISTMGPDIRSKIGYMAEYDSLDPGLTAVDQVRYAGELLGMRPDQATQRAHEYSNMWDFKINATGR